LFRYEGELREVFLKYKFRDKSYLREFFADSISRLITESNSNSKNNKISNKKVYNFLNQYDIITPVPLHSKRKLERGYNQAEQVLKLVFEDNNINNNQAFSQILKNNIKPEKYSRSETIKGQIEYNNNILEKVKNIKPQSTKSGAEREQNTKNAFRIKNENAKRIIKQKNVLIFDDIYTTGNTIRRYCAKLVKRGACVIGGIVLGMTETDKCHEDYLGYKGYYDMNSQNLW
jgi:predicted amidophosphoribosyltransferase